MRDPLSGIVTTPVRTTAEVQRTTLRLLVVAQVLGGLGLAAVVAVGPLLARDIFGAGGWTGLPTALATLGTAGAAIPLSNLMDRRGRRPGLALGYLVGGSGAVLVVLATSFHSAALLALGATVFGAGNSASLLARYAAADLAEAPRRGRAVGTVLFSTTIGAVAGPNLLGPTASAAEALGLSRLTGPFLLAVLAYCAAAGLIVLLLRPDPLLLARSSAPSRELSGVATDASMTPLERTAVVAIMMTAQLLMVSVMTMTPVDMADHDKSLRLIGVVISFHLAGMYLFSPLVGLLTDRLGGRVALTTGALALMLSTLATAFGNRASVELMAASLGLLGLGWSLCLIAGSSIIVERTALAARARTQGRADLFIGLSGAAGAAGSGVIVSALSFTFLSTGAAAIAGCMVIGLLGPARQFDRRPATDGP